MLRSAAFALGIGLAMLLASPAMAFHCKGSHVDDPGCNGSSPNVVPLVVRDASDAAVGAFFDYDEDGFFVQTVVQTDVEANSRKFIVEMNDNDFQSSGPTQDFAWSEQTDCADPHFKTPQILLGMEFAFVVDGIAYISDLAEVPGNITAMSVLGSNGQCTSPISSNVSGVVSTVSVDLDALFTPPFVLGF